MRSGDVRLLAGVCLSLLMIGGAHAAKRVDACGGLLVDSATRCEVTMQIGCLESCTPKRMLKGCTHQMVPGCREVCQDPPPPVCTGNCGGTCEDRCKVDDLVCKNGCGKECMADCGSRCADAKDPAHCRAACETNCGHECDVQCAELPVDASCLEHCYKCCSGSCTAQANLDCQMECQEGGMEGCQDGMMAACEEGCDADGALFCDGQFVISGLNMTPCVVALKRAGVKVKVDPLSSLASVRGVADSLRNGDLRDGCIASVHGSPSAPLWVLAFGLFFLRRR